MYSSPQATDSNNYLLEFLIWQNKLIKLKCNVGNVPANCLSGRTAQLLYHR